VSAIGLYDRRPADLHAACSMCVGVTVPFRIRSLQACHRLSILVAVLLGFWEFLCMWFDVLLMVLTGAWLDSLANTYVMPI
jgi:hypothetical protein